MPFDIKAMARAVVAEAEGDKRDLWLLDAGIRKKSVRLDLPLRQSAEVLYIIRRISSELPNICARIERESEDSRRLLVAQMELSMLGASAPRKRTASAKRVGAEGANGEPAPNALVWPPETLGLKGSVRLDLPLRQSAEILHILRWLSTALPAVRGRIERETEERRRLAVAQMELREIGKRVARSHRRTPPR